MAPVFFVAEHGVVSSETANYLKSGAFDHLLVLGGNMHIPNAFLASCEAVGIQTERVCGSDPYDANELINDRMASSSSGRGSIAIERLIVTSVWNPYDALAAAAYAAKTHSAFLLEDPQNLDSVAHAISYIQKKGGAVKHLTFLGDMMRFNELDKEILGKAVATAIKTSSDKI